MIRRQLIIEWNDDCEDTDEDCAKSFIAGDWTIQDLQFMADEIALTVKVQDAPTQ